MLKTFGSCKKMAIARDHRGHLEVAATKDILLAFQLSWGMSQISLEVNNPAGSRAL